MRISDRSSDMCSSDLTVVLVGGSWVVQLLVSATAGYALAVIRPWFGRIVYGAFLVTLFVPATVTLIALYLTVLDMPLLGISLTDTPWAVWLPAGAHAFKHLLVKQFFERSEERRGGKRGDRQG